MFERTLTFHTFSKSYAMCGMRVGTAAGPEHLIKAMSKLHILTSVCAPTLSQELAASALLSSQTCVGKMVKEYDRRRRTMVGRLNEMPGIECVVPKGAFYAFPDISSFKLSSLKFAERLLAEAKVAVVPGSEFGRCGEGFIRCSYATALPTIEKALERLEKFVKEL
jgi:aminotransferase